MGHVGVGEENPDMWGVHMLRDSLPCWWVFVVFRGFLIWEINIFLNYLVVMFKISILLSPYFNQNNSIGKFEKGKTCLMALIFVNTPWG